jgi:hypothetical protein
MTKSPNVRLIALLLGTTALAVISEAGRLLAIETAARGAAPTAYAMATKSADATQTACLLDKAVEDGAAAAERQVKDFIDPRAYQVSSEQDRARQARDHVTHGDRFRIEADMKRHDVRLDLLQATVRWEKKEIRISVPAPAQCKIGITNIPEWYGLWTVRMMPHDILMPCVKPKQIVLTIPVPEVKTWWGPTQGSFSVPEFRQRDFHDELNDAEQQIRRLDDELRTGPERIRRDSVARTEAEIRKLIAQHLTGALTVIDETEAATIGPLEKQRAELAANADAARGELSGAGGDPAEIDKAFAPGLAALDAAIAAVRGEFGSHRNRVRSEFAQLEAKYLAVGPTVSAPACPATQGG